MDFSIFCLFFILLSTLAVWGIIYFNQQRQSKKDSWKQLADNNGFNFIDNFPEETAYVVGNYLGHRLKLNTYDDPVTNAGWYTRATLSIEQINSQSRGLSEQSIEEVIEQIQTNFGFNLRGRLNVDENGSEVIYTQRGIENEIKYLQRIFILLYEVAQIYPDLVPTGGALAAQLHQLYIDEKIDESRPLVQQLLRNISRDTTTQFSHRYNQLICVHCLVHFDAHKIDLSTLESVTYYGCRDCRQSREYFEFDGWMVVLLDSGLEERQIQQNKVLKVNWYTHNSLFDFDEVQILRATDEEVERFSVRVGNDTDPVRQHRYQQMQCIVSPECKLSENTLRILQHTFGQLKIQDVKS